MHIHTHLPPTCCFYFPTSSNLYMEGVNCRQRTTNKSRKTHKTNTHKHHRREQHNTTQQNKNNKNKTTIINV